MTAGTISDEEVRFFHEHGYLIVRGALLGPELARVQDATGRLYDYGTSEVRHDPDYRYAKGHITGKQTLARIDYIIDKDVDMRILLANPFILRATERLQGADLVPTWDAMVVKAPGEGIAVPWHRDAAPDFVGDGSIFNVDFYLDAATHENCVWIVARSHLWDKSRADAWIEQNRTQISVEDYRRSGAIPAIMQPGDVLFHNILAVHGSPATTASALRRVVYYEFRPAHVEAVLGPHVPAYVRLKQSLLLACIELRKAAKYIPSDEIPFTYHPPAPYNEVTFTPGESVPTFRYAHGDFWRRQAE